MNQSEPVWYEALRAGPRRSEGFTRNMEAAVRGRSQEPHSGRGRMRAKRLAAGLALAAAVAAVVVAGPLSSMWPWGGDSAQYADGGAARSPLQEGELWTAESAAAAPQQATIAAEPAERWQSLIDGRYPETKNELLLVHSAAEDEATMLVVKRYELKGLYSLSLSTERYERQRNGEWLQRHAMAFTVASPLTDDTEKLKAWLGPPYFFGLAADPDIAAVEVVDSKGERTPAELIAGKDGRTYWFAMIGQTQTEKRYYTVEALDAEGHVLESKYK